MFIEATSKDMNVVSLIFFQIVYTKNLIIIDDGSKNEKWQHERVTENMRRRSPSGAMHDTLNDAYKG